MGLRWNFDIEFWRADVADLEQLTPQAIAEHCPRLQHGELLIIEEDINSLHLRDRKIHRSMQAAIRQAVMNATTRLSFFTQIKSFNRDILASDLYQGSRLIAHVMDMMHNYLQDASIKYLPKACELVLQLKTRPDMENSEVHELVENLENHIELLNFSGSIGGEQEIMRLVLKYMQDPSRAVFAMIAHEIRDNNTFANFRAAVIRYLPVDVSTFDVTTQSVATAVQISEPSRRHAQKNKVIKKYSPEQQEEHIKKLHLERKLTKQENERLKEELERKDKEMEKLRRELQDRLSKKSFGKTKARKSMKLRTRTTAMAAATKSLTSSSGPDSKEESECDSSNKTSEDEYTSGKEEPEEEPVDLPCQDEIRPHESMNIFSVQAPIEVKAESEKIDKLSEELQASLKHKPEKPTIPCLFVMLWISLMETLAKTWETWSKAVCIICAAVN